MPCSAVTIPKSGVTICNTASPQARPPYLGSFELELLALGFVLCGLLRCFLLAACAHKIYPYEIMTRANLRIGPFATGTRRKHSTQRQGLRTGNPPV